MVGSRRWTPSPSISLCSALVLLGGLFATRPAAAMSMTCEAGDLPTAVAKSAFVYEGRVESWWPQLHRTSSGDVRLYRSYTTSVVRQWKGPLRATIQLDTTEFLESRESYLFFVKRHYWPVEGSLDPVSCNWTRPMRRAEPHVTALGTPCNGVRQLPPLRPEGWRRRGLRVALAGVYAGVATLDQPEGWRGRWELWESRFRGRWWPLGFVGTRGWQALLWILLLLPAFVVAVATARPSFPRQPSAVGVACMVGVDLAVLAALLVPIWRSAMSVYRVRDERWWVAEYIHVPDLQPQEQCRAVSVPAGWKRIGVGAGYSIAIPPTLTESRDSRSDRADYRDGDVILRAEYVSGYVLGVGPPSFSCRMIVDGVPLNLAHSEAVAIDRVRRADCCSWHVSWSHDKAWYRNEIPQMTLSLYSRNARDVETILAVAQSMRRMSYLAPAEEGDVARAWDRLLRAALGHPQCGEEELGRESR